MMIGQLRRMKLLSEIPTHSAESLEELKELVRQATIELVQTGEGKCGACVHYDYDHPFRCTKCSVCYEYFQLKMDER